jgi:hypothetical protein
MDSAYAKFARAKVHRDLLDADVQAFRDRDPHDFPYSTSDHLFDPSLMVITYRMQVKEEPPSTWGLIVGDILTNLRASLDHAVYGHAAARNRLTEAQEKRLQFPILCDPDQWLGTPAIAATATTPAKDKVDSAHKKLKPFLDPAVLNVIEQSQPYHHTPPGQDPLAVLNSLVNQDKHRTVRVVTYVRDEFDVEHADFEVVTIDAPPKPMTDGAIAAVLYVRRPLRRRGQEEARWHPGQFKVVNGYGERIDLPSAGFNADVRNTMSILVDRVEKVLTDLKRAGC